MNGERLAFNGEWISGSNVLSFFRLIFNLCSLLFALASKRQLSYFSASMFSRVLMAEMAAEVSAPMGLSCMRSSVMP